MLLSEPDVSDGTVLFNLGRPSGNANCVNRISFLPDVASVVSSRKLRVRKLDMAFRTYSDFGFKLGFQLITGMSMAITQNVHHLGCVESLYDALDTGQTFLVGWEFDFSSGSVRVGVK